MMTFRKDINGLRAIAVIAVVLFHFNADWMPGGFAGVDVFFVISGFLMTGIIFKGIELKSFSILRFYVDRGNRIIPPLAFVCISLLIFGWFYLTPVDYRALGKHVFSSMGFVSNLIYLKESGYFDAASHSKWLLHTWSLSAEWQFYIIYPLALVAMRKFMSINAMKKIILFGTIAGFIFCVIATIKWPKAAYYLLPTRAWEMMIGGVAYLYPLAIKEERKKYLEWLGLAFIASSYSLIRSESPWPGYLALLPVFGSFLIIQARRSDSFFTSNAVFQKIGTWSYSIYLWHWPLVVAIYYFSLASIYIYMGLALSVLLGFFSNKYIEKIKFYNHPINLVSILKYKPAYVALIVSATGIVVFQNNGFFNRYNNIDNIQTLESNRYSAESYYRKNLMNSFSNNGESFAKTFLVTLDGQTQTKSTVLNYLNTKLGESSYLVIGDSHGRDFFHALRLSYPNINFAMIHQSSCVPATYGKCFSILNDIRNDYIVGNKNLKGIIFASLYENDIGLRTLIEDINKKIYGNIPIFVVSAGPRLDKSVTELAIAESKVKDNYELSSTNDKAIEINKILSNIKDVIFFDKYSIFCLEGNCKLNSGLNPYIWDTGHLSLLGIEKISESISAINFLKEDLTRLP
ncbi:acyltransferase family protein [Pseudomonas sp. 65/3-MNA-CIBAN-0223]|uniref:acyltransferase family protein n=1 Tax=Pseudomonas sp. 65/3-MNA-CIBAN-0223 TaxID=3140476 RepID=UPI003326A544